MTNRQHYTLADLTTQISYGYTASASTQEIGPKFLRITDIQDGRVNWDSVPFCKAPNSMIEKHLLQPGDIVVARTGNSTGENYIYTGTQPTVFASYLIRMRVNTSLADPFFVWYQMRAPSWWHFISCNKTKSAQAGANATTLAQYVIRTPPLAEQKKIAAVLSALDAKIECNNRINAELEEMAKAIYNYWFLQFDFPDENGKPYKSSGGKMIYNFSLKRKIPLGWVNGTFDDLGHIIGGSTPSTKNPQNFTNDGTAWITPYDLSNNLSNKFISRGALDVSDEGIRSASLKKYPIGTVLLSSRAPIGYMAIARNELTTNQGFKSIIPTKKYSSEFIYYTLKNSLKTISQYASGSTFKEISGGVLKTIEICLPSLSIIESFTKTITPVFKKQDVLEQENQKLKQLRDWLLPLLMNGQVNVV